MALSDRLSGSKLTKNMISIKELASFKESAFLINTSRGGVVNEGDLAKALSGGLISGAAVDVFEHEPYSGPLTKLRTCLLTCHMGSMSQDCRARMEIEAVEEAIRFILGSPLINEIPKSEIEVQNYV